MAVVQTFKAPGFRCVGSELFGEMRERSPKRTQSGHAPPDRPPWQIDANDGETYFVVCVAVRADDIHEAEEYARRLAKLRAIELDLSWTFRRAKVLRGRRTVTRTQTIRIDCEEFRAHVRRQWATNRPDLADLLPAD